MVCVFLLACASFPSSLLCCQCCCRFAAAGNRVTRRRVCVMRALHDSQLARSGGNMANLRAILMASGSVLTCLPLVRSLLVPPHPPMALPRPAVPASADLPPPRLPAALELRSVDVLPLIRRRSLRMPGRAAHGLLALAVPAALC
jgi:hypothetical protein